MKLSLSLSGVLVVNGQRCDNVGADEVRCDPIGCPPDVGGIGCNAGGQVQIFSSSAHNFASNNLMIKGHAMPLLW